MKLTTRQKPKRISHCQFTEEFETIQPIAITHHVQSGVSTYSQIKTIRYQSSEPPHEAYFQRDLTDYQRQELERQRKKQMMMFHMGNHEKTVSDILKFRNEQFKQSQTSRPYSIESSQQQQINPRVQQRIEQQLNQQITTQEHPNKTQIKMWVSPQQSKTTSNLQSNIQTNQGLYSSNNQSDSRMKSVEINNYNQPAQFLTQKRNSSLLGSGESKLSPIRQDEIATFGDTGDNFQMFTQSSQTTTNPLNFTFQDHKSQQKKELSSITRALFNSVDTQKSNFTQQQDNQYSSVASEQLELDQFKQQNLQEQQSQQKAAESERLLSQPINNKLSNSRFELENNQIPKPQFYLSFKNQGDPLSQQTNSYAFSQSTTPAGETKNFTLNLTSELQSKTGNGDIKSSRDSLNTNKGIFAKNLLESGQEKREIDYLSQKPLSNQLVQIQKQEIPKIEKPTLENLSKYNSYSTVETNQIGQLGYRSAEPKLTTTHNFLGSPPQQIDSESKLCSIEQLKYYSLTNTPLPSTERQFKIKLTKIPSQVSEEEYQLRGSHINDGNLQQNSQNLFIQLVEQRKSDYLNSLQVDNTPGPSTNKSEVVKRFKASQLYNNDSKPNQVKFSNYSEQQQPKYDFSKRVEAITSNDVPRSSQLSSAYNSHLFHQAPSNPQLGQGRINNFVRKSQELNQNNPIQTHIDSSNYISYPAIEQQGLKSSNVQSQQNIIPKQSYHIPENYSIIQTSSAVNPYQYDLSRPYSYSLAGQTNNQTSSVNQPSGHLRQYSTQNDSKSSVSMIKNLLEGTQEQQQSASASGFFTKDQNKSLRSSQLDQIMNKYKLMKEEDNLKESSKFFYQAPPYQQITKNSLTSLTNLNTRNSNTPVVYNIQTEQKESIQPTRDSLGLFETDPKLKQILNDIQTKISLRNSQSLDQISNFNTNKLSVPIQTKPDNGQVFMNQPSIQNQIPQQGNNAMFSTLESSNNLNSQNNYTFSNNQLYNENGANQSLLAASQPNITFQLSQQTRLSQFGGSKKELDYNSPLNKNSSIAQYGQFESNNNNNDNYIPQSEKKIPQAEFSSDKSIKEEQDKTYDSENKDEMSVHQKQFEKKVDILSNTHDMSQFLCLTPQVQNGQHFRLMSGGAMDNLTLNNSIQSIPNDQFHSNNQFSQSNFYSQLTTQNNLQYPPVNQSNFQSNKNKDLKNSQELLQQAKANEQEQIQLADQQNFVSFQGREPNLRNSREMQLSNSSLQQKQENLKNSSQFKRASENSLNSPMNQQVQVQMREENPRNSQEIQHSAHSLQSQYPKESNLKNSSQLSQLKRSQEWNVNTPQKQQQPYPERYTESEQQNDIQSPQTIMSVQFNEKQDEQAETAEEYEFTEDKRQDGRKEQDLNSRINKEEILAEDTIMQSPLECPSCKNDVKEDSQGYFKAAKLFYNRTDCREIEDTDNSKSKTMQESDAFQTQDTLLTSAKNTLNFKFNTTGNQSGHFLSPSRNNLGFYQYDTIHIDGKAKKDEFQQTDLIEMKSAFVQTQDQTQSKRNSIFDECTKLFSPKMKFIEPDFKGDECMMVNISHQSSQIDLKDLNKDDASPANQLRENQFKSLRKSDLMKQKQNQQQQQKSSSNGNYETGYINSSLMNSQKQCSDNEEAVMTQQEQIYNKIFEADELPLVHQNDEDNLFSDFNPFEFNQFSAQNKYYQNNCSESEKKKIQNQIDGILNKKVPKSSSKGQSQKPTQKDVNLIIKKEKQNPLQSQLNNNKSPNKKLISFNNKIETRKMVGNLGNNNNPKQQKSKVQDTQKVFDRLYPKQSSKQQIPVLEEVHQLTSKSKSKGRRSTSGKKDMGEMDFIRINKQNIPYMMRRKVDDKFMLFKKAVEVNLENMISDQKSHQIKSIILDDDKADKDNLQDIFCKSLANRTQKNLVSYDTITMNNQVRYNPSYNP